MKRPASLLVILLSLLFIAHTECGRTDLPAAAAPIAAKAISAKLNELDARLATLQTNLAWSSMRLKMQTQRQ